MTLRLNLKAPLKTPLGTLLGIKNFALSLTTMLLLSACASTPHDDGKIGKGVTARIDEVNAMIDQGKLGMSSDPRLPSTPLHTQSSWQGFERDAEEHMDLVFAPLSEGAMAWGEVHVDVMVKPSTWKAKK